MKKSILAVIAAVFMSFGANASTNLPALSGPAIFYTGVFGALYYAAQNEQPKFACESEPLRKVAWANNPNGYNFTVAGCDYQAKKDRLVIVK